MKYARDIASSARMLEIARDGIYTVHGKEIALPRRPDQLRQALYCSAEEAARLASPAFSPSGRKAPSMVMGLISLDSLRTARYLHDKYPDAEKGVLVLNFAHPHRPGGSFRENPGTQEEQLCHYTTLVSSLETPEAAPFYKTNKAANSAAQTDAMVLSPHVMVLRDTLDTLTEEPFPIAVLTVSAPIAKRMTPEEKENLDGILQRRIHAMVRFALTEGYRHLVLGAWGCGNFGNDSDIVAEAFHRALTQALPDGSTPADFFEAVLFGIPSGSPSNNRWRTFARYFPEITP